MKGWEKKRLKTGKNKTMHLIHTIYTYINQHKIIFFTNTFRQTKIQILILIVLVLFLN